MWEVVVGQPMSQLHKTLLCGASSPQYCSVQDWGEDTKSEGDAESYVSDV